MPKKIMQILDLEEVMNKNSFGISFDGGPVRATSFRDFLYGLSGYGYACYFTKEYIMIRPYENRYKN